MRPNSLTWRRARRAVGLELRTLHLVLPSASLPRPPARHPTTFCRVFSLPDANFGSAGRAAKLLLIAPQRLWLQSGSPHVLGQTACSVQALNRSFTRRRTARHHVVFLCDNHSRLLPYGRVPYPRPGPVHSRDELPRLGARSGSVSGCTGYRRRSSPLSAFSGALIFIPFPASASN